MLRTILITELRLFHRTFNKGLSTRPAWDIITGVCVERPPIISPPMNQIQKKYNDYLQTIEVEKSLKSDHELRHESDLIQAELLKNENADIDVDVVSKITAQDFEDASNEELAKFTFAKTETEADNKGDRTTTERCLDKHLVLVQQIKLGKDAKMLFPQGHWKEGETLRQTAERVLNEHCGSDINVKFLSNAPCGVYKYKYPSEINGKVGAKVFFYYANYKSGSIQNKNKSQWLSRNELKEILPDRYCKSVSEFLIDENC